MTTDTELERLLAEAKAADEAWKNAEEDIDATLQGARSYALNKLRHAAVEALPGHIAELARLRAENERLRSGLNAAIGYLMNAQIDLRTGAPKPTAINTINGGIEVARAALTEGET
jgi:hypothetical protein